MNISVLILTLNEERSLPACLESVKGSDDVVVLDSFSNDRTVEIAKAYGARVVQRKFDNERDHRTFSVRDIAFKHPWVYNPDADEVTPPKLWDEMLSVTADTNRPEIAYRLRFKTLFMGRWIKHSSLYPTWVVRLFHPERISFERAINLRYVVDGPSGQLQNHFHHYAFNRGYGAWFEKHNAYALHEAEESLKSLRNGHIAWGGLLSADPVVRRSRLKELSFRVPCRPSLRFIYMYFLRGGILDGRAGLIYCRLLSMYEYMIVLKMEELKRRERGEPV